jgi:hypothetical protein
MSAPNQLEDLLLLWEESTHQGKEVPLEDLCRDCPELTNELQQRIDALRAMSWVERLKGEPRSGQLFLASLAADQSNGNILFPPIGTEPIPGYRLVRQVGRGGFGVVFEASDPKGRSVALKFVPRSDKSVFEQRALEIIQAIHHPHLLPVLGSWQTKESLIIGMALADCTLLDRFDQVRVEGLAGIPKEELLEYFHQAASGIDYLHERNIHHRDIKPQNLLLVGSTLMVADFGLARILAHTVTGHTGSLTLAYAAPEFFDGQTTRQSDQYCLAVTYCQLRGGRFPFAGTPAQMVAGHLHRSPDLLALPQEERAAVGKALAKRPDDRWATCQQFIEALKAGERKVWPGEKPPLNSLIHFHGWPHRAFWWVTGVIGLVAIAILVLLAIQPPKAVLVRAVEGSSQYGAIRSVAAGEPLDFQGRLVAFTNGGGHPMLWDLSSDALIWELPIEGGTSVALAPSQVAEGLTAGEEKGSLALWDFQKRSVKLRFVGHEDTVTCVAFSEDGKQVLSGSCDQTVQLWDRKTGNQLWRLAGHNSFVSSVAFSPDGRLALSGGWDGRVFLWDLAKGVRLKVFDGHTSKVASVAYSSDGRYGLSCSADHTIRVWDLESGNEKLKIEDLNGEAEDVYFWGRERIVAIGIPTIRGWDLKSGRLLLTSPRHIEGTCGTFVDIQGQSYMLVGTQKDGLQLWRLPKLPGAN